MQEHISGLQDIVAKRTRQIIEWAELRLKRITMSHDADNHPAELYGKDGRIYYRKAGAAGVGLGTGIQGELNADVSFYGSASDDLNFVKFLEWDHDADRLSTQTETFTLGHSNLGTAFSTGFYFYRGTDEDKEASMGWNETADRFEFMEDADAPTFANPTLAEVLMRTLKISEAANVGTITMDVGTGDMLFTDENTSKTLAELATSGAGTYLPLAGGVGSPMSGDLYLYGEDSKIGKIGYIDFDARITTNPPSHSVGLIWFDQTNYVFKYSDGTNWYTIAATSWVSANFNNYSHPSARQCSAGTWAWGSISGKPSFDYLPLAGGTMTALAIINMSGGDVQGLENIQAQGPGGVSLYNSAGSLRGDLASTNYTLRCINAGIDMGDKAINGVDDLRAFDATGMVCRNSGGSSKLALAPTGYAFTAYTHCNMNTYKIVGVGDITFNRELTDAAIVWNEVGDQFNFEAVHGSVYAPLSAAYLKIWSEPLHKAGNIQINNSSGSMEFTDSVTGTKTLEELAGGLWEEVDADTIRPLADHDTIQGRESQNLTIKAASGGILYLG